jgi:hypothetical protein
VNCEIIGDVFVAEEFRSESVLEPVKEEAAAAPALVAVVAEAGAMG